MSFDNQKDKFSYALGLSLASNMLQSGIKAVNYEPMFEAIKDAFEGRSLKIDPNQANQIITEFFQDRQASLGAVNMEEGKAFLEKNKSEEGVVSLKSGLQYKILKKGAGDKPKVTDKVKCHYHGTLISGEVFDSSVDRGQPAVFPVNGVIAGWVEALQMMEVGSKWRLFIPPHLAYGEHGAGGSIGPQATLLFDVELIDIVK